MLDIAFAKAALPKSGVLVLGLGEGAAPSGLAAALDTALGGGLTRALEAAAFTGKKGQSASLLAPGAGLKRVLVFGTGKPGSMDARAAEDLGGAAAAALVREAEFQG